MPFLIATPPLLWGVAVLVRRAQAPTWRLHALVAAIGLVLFYLHVIQLGVFGLAAVVLFPWKKLETPRATWSARAGWLLSLLPCTIALGVWLFATNVGRRVFEVTSSWGGNRPRLDGAIADMHPWFSDAFPDMSDEIVFGLMLLPLAYGAYAVWRDRQKEPFPVRAYWVLPAFCLFLFLTGERSRGPIWPLAPRYMLPAGLLGLPLLAMPAREAARRAMTIGLAAVAALSIANTSWHWVRFDREARDLGDAIAQMEPNKHVASLMFTRHSDFTRFSPFLHVGSYYQAEKGGVVMFTFAGYDQWPYDFKPGRYPLWNGPATPRWEFFPEWAIAKQPLDGYFDYVLVRGRTSEPQPRGYHLKWSRGAWEVYER
jgi:hypothetical protein